MWLYKLGDISYSEYLCRTLHTIEATCIPKALCLDVKVTGYSFKNMTQISCFAKSFETIYGKL